MFIFQVILYYPVDIWFTSFTYSETVALMLLVGCQEGHLACKN